MGVCCSKFDDIVCIQNVAITKLIKFIAHDSSCDRISDIFVSQILSSKGHFEGGGYGLEDSDAPIFGQQLLGGFKKTFVVLHCPVNPSIPPLFGGFVS